MIPISMIAGLAGGAINYFGQKKMIKDQQAQTAARLAGAQGDEAAARAGLEGTQYSVAPALREAYAMSKQDPVADALRANQQRQEAQSLEALKASGPRGLAMLGQVTDAQAQQRADIEADSYTRQQAAAQTFGTQQQDVSNMNIADQRGLLEHDFGRAQGQMDAYQQYGDELGVMKQQLNTSALSSLVGSVVPGVLGEFGPTNIGGMRQFAKGGNVNPFKSGGELPGEFSHKTNPIAIARNGKMVAEATGGETILNPEQSGKIEVLASQGNSPLHAYVRELFKKFNSEK
jgi:hypothetical protein